MLYELGLVELTSFELAVSLLYNVDVAFEIESSPYQLIDLLIADIISHSLQHLLEVLLELNEFHPLVVVGIQVFLRTNFLEVIQVALYEIEEIAIGRVKRIDDQPFYLLLVEFVEEHKVVFLVEAEVVADSHVKLLFSLPFGKSCIAFNELLMDLADRRLS